MIKKFDEYKINEDIDDINRNNDDDDYNSYPEEENHIKNRISREDAETLLFEYYNKCMDEFNGGVSEEAIYMLLDDMYLAEDEE